MKTPEEIKKGLEICYHSVVCDECPYRCKPWTDGGRCVDGLQSDALAHIKQLESQIPRWIPVEERLPEDDQGALVICRDGYITTMVYEYERWWWQGTEDESVTHWMPLPEPPTKEDEK